MKKILMLAMVLIAALGLISCGGGGGGGGIAAHIADNAASGYLGGTWTGTLVSKGFYGTMSLTITVTQNAQGDLVGTAKITGKFSDSKGVLGGTVSNPNGPGDIGFTIAWGTGDTMTFLGTYTASAMSGAYTSLTLADAGTFTLSK